MKKVCSKRHAFFDAQKRCVISHRKESEMSDKMVKVRVISPYKDKEKMLLFQKGEEHEVKLSRAELLVKAKVVEMITEQRAAGNKD